MGVMTLKRLPLLLICALMTVGSCGGSAGQRVATVTQPSTTSVDALATVVPVLTIAPTTTPTTVTPRTTARRPSRGSARTIPPATAAPATALTVPSPAEQGGEWYAPSCLGRKMGRPEAHACWDRLINHYWGSRAGKAFSVMYCESTGRSDARNGSHVGLFQQSNGSTDPETAISHAARRQASEGWGPWDYGCV